MLEESNGNGRGDLRHASQKTCSVKIVDIDHGHTVIEGFGLNPFDALDDAENQVKQLGMNHLLEKISKVRDLVEQSYADDGTCHSTGE